jgi:hypothetical protein
MGKKKESMEQNKYARMAGASYQFGEDEDIKESFSHVRELAGFKLDESLSNEENSVFHNEQTGETVYSIRGTATMEDAMETDMDILFNTEDKSARFAESDAFFKAVVSKYGKDNLTLSAHSMGAEIAIHLSREYDVPAWAFNPGISIEEANDTSHRNNKNKIHMMVTHGDPVSVARAYLKDHDNVEVTYVSQKNIFDSHGVTNFYSKSEQNDDGSFTDKHGMTSELALPVLEAVYAAPLSILRVAGRVTNDVANAYKHTNISKSAHAFSDWMIHPIESEMNALHDMEDLLFDGGWYNREPTNIPAPVRAVANHFRSDHSKAERFADQVESHKPSGNSSTADGGFIDKSGIKYVDSRTITDDVWTTGISGHLTGGTGHHVTRVSPLDTLS